MDKDEYVAYKKARLKEISAMIKESGEKVNSKPMELDDIHDRLEKLKSDYRWLR